MARTATKQHVSCRTSRNGQPTVFQKIINFANRYECTEMLAQDLVAVTGCSMASINREVYINRLLRGSERGWVKINPDKVQWVEID